MGTTVLDLDPISNPHISPIVRKRHEGLAGTDVIQYTGGEFDDEHKIPGIWIVHEAILRITTDATVADRTAHFAIGGIFTNAGSQGAQSVPIPASTVARFTVSRYNVFSDAHPGDTNSYYVGVTGLFGLMQGTSERTAIYLVNGKAGDVYDLYISFLCLNRFWDILPDYVPQSSRFKGNFSL